MDATTVGAPPRGRRAQAPDSASKRAYRSQARQERARQTQARVGSAAAALFAAQGYARTSIRQVAQSAGVSVETIYAGGDKRTLFLHAFQLALRGDIDGTPLLELAALRPAVGAQTLDDLLRAIVDFVVDANALGSRLWIAFVEAAGSDGVLAEAYTRQMDDMRQQGRRVVDHAVGRGLCPAPRDPDRAVDAIWAALHPSQYDLLVTRAGWTPEVYKTWLTSCLRHVLTTL